jgi:hypothetical protein
MRLLFLLILLSSSYFASSNGTLNLSISTSCPDDVLHMNLSSSDGANANLSGVELRLVLYEPYNGFRGLTHPDANGSASLELSRTGDYRIYFNTLVYDHPEFVPFNYPNMCPPAPPKHMDMSVLADCDNSLLLIDTSSSDPLGGVFIQGDSWSSMTGADGKAFLPFDGSDFVFLTAQKKGYTTDSGWFATGC